MLQWPLLYSSYAAKMHKKLYLFYKSKSIFNNVACNKICWRHATFVVIPYEIQYIVDAMELVDGWIDKGDTKSI